VLNELRQYYVSHGISPIGFNCELQPTCRSACTAGLIQGKEAFVGSEYEKGTLPRVLFISLDPARDDSVGDPRQRTLDTVRVREESLDPTKLNKGRHWYQTHKYAFELLAPIAKGRGLEGFDLRGVTRFFAHTNSAKCKELGRGTPQGRNVLFENCRRFLPGEVSALRPNVIVTQGSLARIAIDGAFGVLRQERHPTSPRYRSTTVNIDGRPVLVYNMYHPTARGGLYQREVRAAWEWYMAIGHDFLSRLE
jgi:hypothetical protein